MSSIMVYHSLAPVHVPAPSTATPAHRHSLVEVTPLDPERISRAARCTNPGCVAWLVEEAGGRTRGAAISQRCPFTVADADTYHRRQMPPATTGR